MHSRRFECAAGVGLELAEVTVALERELAQPLPMCAIATVLTLPIMAAPIAIAKLVAAMGLAGHHNPLAGTDLPNHA